MNKDQLAKVLDANPHLEKALALQLIAMGYVVRRGIPLIDQLDAIPQAVMVGVFNSIRGTPKAVAKTGTGLVSGAINLTEDLIFGSINAVSPGPKIPAYRHSLNKYPRRQRRKPIKFRSR
ncbi:MAG: hypothetical protein AAF478_05510 [Pseudomonadota bacterium]